MTTHAQCVVIGAAITIRQSQRQKHKKAFQASQLENMIIILLFHNDPIQ